MGVIKIERELGIEISDFSDCEIDIDENNLDDHDCGNSFLIVDVKYNTYI